MQFRTPINITPCGFRIGYAQRGLLLGSCFAENIGMRMKRYKLPVVFNPFGILFNPASVARTLTRLDSGKLYEANDLTRSGDLWVSFDHHGSLASVDRDEALKTINQAVQSGARALREAGYLILTNSGRPEKSFATVTNDRPANFYGGDCRSTKWSGGSSRCWKGL